MIDYWIYIAVVLLSMTLLTVWLKRGGATLPFLVCAWSFCLAMLGLALMTTGFCLAREKTLWLFGNEPLTAPFLDHLEGTRRGVLGLFGLNHLLFLAILSVLWRLSGRGETGHSGGTDLEKERKEARDRARYLVEMSQQARTPLSAILGFADILTSDGFSRLDEPERRRIVDVIKKNGSQLLSQINDIADLVVDSADEQKIRIESVKFRELIQDVCETLRPHLELKRLTLSEEWIRPVPEFVRTDPFRLKQIMFHLLGNAIKFTDSGRIVVRCSAERLPDATNPRFRQVRIQIIDTGVGMTPETVDRILSTDIPSDSMEAVKSKTGLHLVVQLLHRLDGSLQVQSRLNQGSDFSLFLPIPPDAPQQEMDLSPQKAASGENDSRNVSTELWKDNFSDASTIISCGEERPSDADLYADVKETLENLIELGRRRANRLSETNFETVINEPLPEKTLVLQGCRVLLVDDVPINQVLISFQLQEAGAEVDIAENGREGIEKIRKAEDDGRYYDVILMDMQMPVLDGYEATRQLRSFGYLKPIIALTAKAHVGDREKTIDAGCNNYMTKPVDREKLIDTINIYRSMTKVR